MNSLLNVLLAWLSCREPSGDVQVRSRSMNSTHPPGLVCLVGVKNPECSINKQGGLLETLPVQPGPISDGVAHHAAMDVVEWLMVGPVFLDVVHFEPDVRGNPTVQ